MCLGKIDILLVLTKSLVLVPMKRLVKSRNNDLPLNSYVIIPYIAQGHINID